MFKDRQRIAVIGSGAVGGYYGGRLAEAGHDVRFLMRRDYDAVLSKGLKIVSPEGDVHLSSPFVVRNSHDLGTVDWVVCALKATSIEDVPELVRPCLEENTRILVLMNGLGLEDRFSKWFGEYRIFGGLAFVCINRGEPGIITHLDYGAVTLGHYLNNATELERATGLWASTKVPIEATPSLLKARWMKLCWNIPFNGLAVTAGGVTTDVILADWALKEEARCLMEEVIETGNADLAAHGEEARMDRHAVIESMFSRTETMGAYRPSTAIDFVEGRPMEVDAIFGEPLRRARLLGTYTPKLALITELLTSLASQGGHI